MVDHQTCILAKKKYTYIFRQRKHIISVFYVHFMYIYMAVNCEEPGLASRGTKKQEGHHHLTRSQLRRSRRILTNARRKLASSGLKDRKLTVHA